MLQDLLKQEHRAAANTGPGLISRNIAVEGRRSSMRLEASMWDALREICRRERVTLAQLCTSVARAKRPALTLTVALRVLIATTFATRPRKKATPGRGQIAGADSRPPLRCPYTDTERGRLRTEARRMKTASSNPGGRY